MKPSTKISLSLVVMALLTIGGLIAQNRATDQGEPIHLTAEQVQQMISALPEQQRKPYQDPVERQRRLDMLRQALIFGAEARRLGYANRPENIFQMQLQRQFLLSTAYKQKHPEVQVTSEEIDAYFRRHPDDLIDFARYNPRFRGQGGAVSQRTRQQLGQIRILAERALKEGLDKDPGLALQLKYFPESVLRQSLIKDLQERVRVSEQEIRDYYRQHKDQFVEVRARHILFSTRQRRNARNGDSTPPAPDRDAVRRRALEVLNRIKAGEDFAQLAKETSDDPGSRNRGGDLGYFPRGRMTAKFEQVAFTLKPGQVSDLVETPYGFHIIKVEDRRIRPLDESLRRSIRNQLRQRKLDSEMGRIKQRYQGSITVAMPKPTQAKDGATPPSQR